MRLTEAQRRVLGHLYNGQSGPMNRAQARVRAALVNEGMVRSNVDRTDWEITESGVQYVERHRLYI